MIGQREDECVACRHPGVTTVPASVGLYGGDTNLLLGLPPITLCAEHAAIAEGLGTRFSWCSQCRRWRVLRANGRCKECGRAIPRA